MNRLEITMKEHILQLPTGKQTFKAFIKGNYYFVDKTKYIKSVFQDDSSQVLLITRPRRFGKTLTMSMFEAFLSLNYDDPNDLSEHIELFKDKEIYKDKEFCDNFMGKYPVLSISLSRVYGNTFEIAFERLADLINNLASNYSFLMESEALSKDDKYKLSCLLDSKTLAEPKSLVAVGNSLFNLAQFLYKHFKQQCIVLIDEYDVPLAKAANQNYYKDMRDLISSMFGGVLKDGEKFVKKAVVTGCLRVAKESIFTGVNNFKVNTIFSNRSALSTIIGFTKEDTESMLDYYNLSKYKALVQENYDGYNFNNHEMYCSWDVVSFCDDAIQNDDGNITANCYWYHTGSTDVIRDFLGFISSDDADSMQTLVDGGSIKKNIHVNMNHEDLKDHDSDDFWSLLAYTGYLTPAKGAIFDIDNEPIDLVIPNNSILKAFRKNILEYFTKDKAQLAKASDIIKAIFDGKALDLSNALEDALAQYISVRDFSSSEPKESYYQGFLNGFFSSQKDMLKGYASNAELGNGYADITFKNKRKDLAVIIEIKHANDEFQNQAKATEALEQIEKNKYVLNYKNDGYVTKIFCYGICFNKKSCYVAFKEIQK
ncbi:MAG: ATP-binding protein [Succinivibrio sp.]|nr:ATP-binding protein [Succinivibrio sp.]